MDGQRRGLVSAKDAPSQNPGRMTRLSFQTALTFQAQGGEGEGLEAGLLDGSGAGVADAVGAAVDLLQGGIDLIQQAFHALGDGQVLLPFEGFGGQVGGVILIGGEFGGALGDPRCGRCGLRSPRIPAAADLARRAATGDISPSPASASREPSFGVGLATARAWALGGALCRGRLGDGLATGLAAFVRRFRRAGPASSSAPPWRRARRLRAWPASRSAWPRALRRPSSRPWGGRGRLGIGVVFVVLAAGLAGMPFSLKRQFKIRNPKFERQENCLIGGRASESGYYLFRIS